MLVRAGFVFRKNEITPSQYQTSTPAFFQMQNKENITIPIDTFQGFGILWPGARTIIYTRNTSNIRNDLTLVTQFI